MLDAFHDGGWTPPFNRLKFPVGVIGAITDSIFFGGREVVFPTAFEQGQASQVSLVNTQGQHKNSSMTSLSPDDKILIKDKTLISIIIKTRAGKATDDIGVKLIKAPFHVPWVWCEILVAYAGKGRFGSLRTWVDLPHARLVFQ